MIGAIRLLVGEFVRLFRTRRRLLLENLALRQQLGVLKRRHPRPRLASFDKVFWILVRRFWSGWKQALPVVRVYVFLALGCSKRMRCWQLPARTCHGSGPRYSRALLRAWREKPHCICGSPELISASRTKTLWTTRSQRTPMNEKAFFASGPTRAKSQPRTIAR